MDEEIESKSKLHNNNVQVKSEPNIYEMEILTGTESQTSDMSVKVDIGSHETAKSFQNVGVSIKEELMTDGPRGHYSYYVTEGIDQSSDHQSHGVYRPRQF